jgi:PAS domain-containing protein
VPETQLLVPVLYLISAAVATAAAVTVWRRGATAGARPLALMLAAAAFWALCDVIELYQSTADARRLVSQIQYFGVVSAAPLFLHAALGLSGRRAALGAGWLAAIWGIPLATLAFVWTNPRHHWVWTAIHVPAGGHGPGIYEYGPWFWVLTLDHYVLSLIGIVILVRASGRVEAAFRLPILVAIPAIAAPWLGNIVYVFKLGPLPGVNWLAISIIGSGLVFAWLTLREGLFDVLPAARQAAFELLQDGVLVVADSGRVLLANRTAGRLLDLERPQRLPAWLAQGLPAGETRTVTHPGTGRQLEIVTADVNDRWGTHAAQLLMVRDVTAREQLARERESLIGDLKTALARIRTLEGLLPICARCKKIRSDSGRWDALEVYFEQHTDVEFTHGICPDCAASFFDSEEPA